MSSIVELLNMKLGLQIKQNTNFNLKYSYSSSYVYKNLDASSMYNCTWDTTAELLLSYISFII